MLHELIRQMNESADYEVNCRGLNEEDLVTIGGTSDD